MNKEAQRIAIAEACGWKRKPEFDYTRLMRGTVDAMERVEMWGTDQGHLIPLEKLPDYLNDLNAMHKAEKMLALDQRDAYATELYSMLPGDENCGPIDMDDPKAGDVMIASQFQLIHATSQQRCEAILKTLGRWRDDLP